MADVKVRKQEASESGGGRELQRGERGMSRQRGWETMSMSPFGFFSSDPFSMMRHLHEEMDRTFSRFLGASESRGGTAAWNPAVEVREDNGQLKVCADLPGLKPDDVKIEVTDNALIIQGERKHEYEDKSEGKYRSERSYGYFYRQIPLPEGADPDKAKAQFRDGVLEVTLPVAEQRSNRRAIPIEGGASSGKK
jgi:HSP20 family protein